MAILRGVEVLLETLWLVSSTVFIYHCICVPSVCVLPVSQGVLPPNTGAVAGAVSRTAVTPLSVIKRSVYASFHFFFFFGSLKRSSNPH